MRPFEILQIEPMGEYSLRLSLIAVPMFAEPRLPSLPLCMGSLRKELILVLGEGPSLSDCSDKVRWDRIFNGERASGLKALLIAVS